MSKCAEFCRIKFSNCNQFEAIILNIIYSLFFLRSVTVATKGIEEGPEQFRDRTDFKMVQHFKLLVFLHVRLNSKLQF